jgi:H+-transporting ATPase
MALALAWLVFSLGALFVTQRWMHMDLGQSQTLMFLMLVASGQANVYVVRERRHFWRSRPGPWLLASTAATLIVVVGMVITGILVAPVEPAAVAGLLLAVAAYAFIVDLFKRTLFVRLQLA